jgi:hypothetical protein
MSSSSAILPDQYWQGTAEFRDASDYILFKKRQGIRQLVVPLSERQSVRPPILQSLQNRTSYQFSELNCRTGGCPGGFPRVRLTSDIPI